MFSILGQSARNLGNSVVLMILLILIALGYVMVIWPFRIAQKTGAMLGKIIGKVGAYYGGK